MVNDDEEGSERPLTLVLTGGRRLMPVQRERRETDREREKERKENTRSNKDVGRT